MATVESYRMDNPLDYLKKIKHKIKFFDNLENRHLDTLVYSIKFVKHKEGEVIFLDGSEGPKHIFYLLSGNVNFTKNVEDKEIVLANAKTGTLYGEMRHVTGERRNATAVAGVGGATSLQFMIRIPSKNNQEAFMYYYKNISEILIEKLVAMNNRLITK